MNNKELYKIWAPTEADRWSKFAKPALFVHTDAFAFLNSSVEAANIPLNITQLQNEKTAIIVDLPSATSVAIGLGLAKHGFRPVPLYNGIHETKIGGLESVIDNQSIVDALVTGADVLSNLTISNDAPPAFLLDARREMEVVSTDGMYDNRWRVEFEDLPDASYMKATGINRLVIWTEKEVGKDLVGIIDRYRDMGIEVLTFIDGNLVSEGSRDERGSTPSSGKVGVSAPISTQIKEAVRKFENARFGLMLITILAFVNLFFMFFAMDAPILYTAPSLMWMVYLWVPYGMANFLAMVFPIVYLILYLTSQKKRDLMLAALGLFGFDVLIFYIYAFFIYGANEFTEGYFYYGVLVFVPPIALITFLIKGALAWKELEGVSAASYLKHLEKLDKMPSSDPDGRVRTRHSRYRGFRDSRGNYRGYRGYGGTGHGGYGGGYGGGFGG